MHHCKNCNSVISQSETVEQYIYCPYCGTKYGDNRKFYHQIFMIDVVSYNEPVRETIEDVSEKIIQGEVSADVVETKREIVSAREAAKLMRLQEGGDPRFFMLDEDGNDWVLGEDGNGA